jgi:signal transduction histidine kinase
MPSKVLYRLSGIALLLGTMLTVLFYGIDLILFGVNPGSYLFATNGSTMVSQRLVELITGPLWLPANLLILVGLMLLVTGLPGMYAYLSKRVGWLGLIGFVLTMVAVLLVGIVNQSLNTFVLPIVAPHVPQMLQAGRTYLDLGDFYPASNLLFILGAFIFGLAILRAGALPLHAKVTGLALIVAAVCNTVHLIPLTGGLWQIITIGSIVGALSFLIGLAIFGYTLVLLPAAEAVQPFLVSTEEGSHMSPAMLYRFSGLALLMGSLLAIPAGILRWEDLTGTKTVTLLANPSFVPSYLMGLIASLLVLLGLPGMFVYVVRPMRWSGFVGFVLIFWSTLMLGVVDMGLYSLGFPLLATLAPHFFNGPSAPYLPPDPLLIAQPAPLAFFIVLAVHLAFCTGVLLFGRAMIRAAVLPHDFDGIGWVFLLAGLFDALVILFALTILSPRTASEAFWPLLVLSFFISFAAFFLALAVTGGVLLARSAVAGPIIGRPLVYGTLTAIVVSGYVLVVGSIGVLVQQTRVALILSLILIGLIAILFQPIRDRLQRAVNRLVYGERDNPYAVLSRLGKHMEATLAPESVLPTIVETIARSLKLPYVAIGLKQDDKMTITTAYGSPMEPQQRFPLVYQAEQLGELILSPRSPGESLTPADQRLMHDLAPQIGVAVHAARVTVDLQRSRERLVTAREEERRRLRRDLHDGLGPQLASLTLKLETARNRLANDPLADALLSDLAQRTQATVADIRRLVYALRPPTLDELGLVSALRELTLQYNEQIAMRFEAPDCLPELPAAVEVAVYRIAQEAVTNVVRHAQAHHCDIRLALDETTGLLALSIQDDGCGLTPLRGVGVGLVSMRERAEELGGTCAIEPVPTGGTRVLAQLPYTRTEVADTLVVTPTFLPKEE